jgi:hypothetical protein
MDTLSSEILATSACSLFHFKTVPPLGNITLQVIHKLKPTFSKLMNLCITMEMKRLYDNFIKSDVTDRMIKTLNLPKRTSISGNYNE